MRVRESNCSSRLQEAVRSSELPNLFEVLKKLTMSATLLDGVTQISIENGKRCKFSVHFSGAVFGVVDLFTPTSKHVRNNEKDWCCVELQIQNVVFLLDVWTLGDLEMARRLNLFVLYFFQRLENQEETRCAVCVAQTESE